MVSIKALIASTLFASAIGGPVSAGVHECTILSPTSNYYSNYTTFKGFKYQLPANPHLTRDLLITDLGDKGKFQLRAKFDSTDKINSLQALTLVQVFPGKEAKVVAVPKLLSDVVTTTEFDGSTSQHANYGEYSVLNGLVKYTLSFSLSESTMSFVVNDDIFIDVIQWEMFPSGKPTITVKQPAYYDLEPRTKPFGECVSP